MVYTAIRSLVIDLSSGDMPAGPLPCFTGTDRLSGISRGEAAEGAARNVIDSRHYVDIPSLADDLIQNEDSTSVKFLNILEEFCNDNSSRFQIKCYQPASICTKKLDHMAHIEELLSTSLHGSTLSFIIEELMKDDLHQHSRNLDWLRRQYFEVHEFTILGKMQALAPLIAKKPIPFKYMEKVAKIIANHLKCFAIRTAQELATMVGSMYTNPYHDCYAGFNKWKSTSHVVLTTIAGPATTLQRLIKDFLNDIYKGLDENKSVAMLIKTKIIPKSRVSEIVRLARSTHFWTQQEASGNQDIFIRNMLQNISARTHRAASLNRGHMRAERLIEQQYVEHHLLLTAAESVTYVAVQLLKACSEIDRAILAMLKGEPVPPGAPKPSNKASGHLSNVLRAGGRSDPRAAKLPDPRFDDGRFHRSDYPGRDNVASLNKKMSDPLIAQSASHHLSIDANAWLPR